VSWRIIVEDIGDALQQIGRGTSIALAAGSYRDRVLTLAGPEGLATAERERPYWEALTAISDRPTAVPHDYGETALLTADLGPVESGLSDRRVLAGLLTRLGAALGEDGRRTVPVMLTNHGRAPFASGPDASRTVGWFTADYPFLLECGASAEAIEEALADVPSQGLGWGVLRWLSPSPVASVEPEVSLNYLGDTDTPEDAGFAVEDRLPGVVITGFRRTRVIELEAERVGGRLRIALRYAPGLHSPEAMRALIEAITKDSTTQEPSWVREGMES
jgi:non-ribosomal peptide synthase protein (TIGR01720 family)